MSLVENLCCCYYKRLTAARSNLIYLTALRLCYVIRLNANSTVLSRKPRERERAEAEKKEGELARMNELDRAAQVETISSLVVSPSTVTEVFFLYVSRHVDVI